MIYTLENVFIELSMPGIVYPMVETLKSTNNLFIRVFGSELFIATPSFQYNWPIHELKTMLPLKNWYFGIKNKTTNVVIWFCVFNPINDNRDNVIYFKVDSTDELCIIDNFFSKINIR